MKNLFSIFIVIVVFTNVTAQYTFNNKFETNVLSDSNYFGRVNSVIQTSDSNFVVAGTGRSIYKMSAIKLDYKGDTIWSYVADLGVKNVNYLSGVIEIDDGNYVMVGAGTTENPGYGHAMIIKLDKNTGDTMWLRKIGLPNVDERFYCVKQTNDKGFILSGLRAIEDTVGSWQPDVYLVKTDSMGVPQWEKCYATPGPEWITSIELTNDNGFLLFGSTRTVGIGAQSMYLLKTDSLGNIKWQKNYGGNFEDWGLAMTKLQDGNYVLAGGTNLNSIDSFASLLIKIDPDGNIIWQKKYLGEFNQQEFSGVKQLATGEIVVCGSSKGNGEISFFGIVKVLNDADGSIVWEKKYDYYNYMPNKEQYIYGMDICKDGGLVLAGMARNLNFDNESAQTSMWVVKTDCIGNDSIWDNVACPIKTDMPDTVIPFNLYPNPSTGAVTLDYFIPQNSENQSISFYDATGKLVQKVDFTGEGQIQLNIDCSGFSNGVYQCVLVSDGEVLRQGRLVLIK